MSACVRARVHARVRACGPIYGLWPMAYGMVYGVTEVSLRLEWSECNE